MRSGKSSAQTLADLKAELAHFEGLKMAAGNIAYQVGLYEKAWRIGDDAGMRLAYRQLDEMCNTPELRLIRGACVVAAAATRDGSGVDHLMYPRVRARIVSEYVSDQQNITREELTRESDGKRTYGGLIVDPIGESEARMIAADWHGGQWSALYGFSSSGRLDVQGALAEATCSMDMLDSRTDPDAEYGLMALIDFLERVEIGDARTELPTLNTETDE